MAYQHAVLIVDDDKTLRTTLTEQLQLDGEFTPEEAGTLTAAMAALERGEPRFDAVILDVSLPDGNGYEFCKQMRDRGFNMPVLMLTGAAGEDDVVRGLNAGANDYVAKPFRLNELLARLRANLRDFENSADAVLQIGNYLFRPAQKQLHDPEQNRRIRLTDKETAILKFLYRAGGKPVARDILLNEVWGYNSEVTTHTLETHVYRLRQKIEADASRSSLLVTQAGGYRLSL